jgi:hypothetical protein
MNRRINPLVRAGNSDRALPTGTNRILVTDDMRRHLLEIAQRLDARRSSTTARQLTREALAGKNATAGEILQLVEKEIKSFRTTQLLFRKTKLKPVRTHPVQEAETEINHLKAFRRRLRVYFTLQRKVRGVVKA